MTIADVYAVVGKKIIIIKKNTEAFSAGVFNILYVKPAHKS